MTNSNPIAKSRSILADIPVVRTNGLQSAVGEPSCKALPVDDETGGRQAPNAPAVARR